MNKKNCVKQFFGKKKMSGEKDLYGREEKNSCDLFSGNCFLNSLKKIL